MTYKLLDAGSAVNAANQAMHAAALCCLMAAVAIVLSGVSLNQAHSNEDRLDDLTAGTSAHTLAVASNIQSANHMYNRAAAMLTSHPICNTDMNAYKGCMHTLAGFQRIADAYMNSTTEAFIAGVRRGDFNVENSNAFIADAGKIVAAAEPQFEGKAHTLADTSMCSQTSGNLCLMTYKNTQGHNRWAMTIMNDQGMDMRRQYSGNWGGLGIAAGGAAAAGALAGMSGGPIGAGLGALGGAIAGAGGYVASNWDGNW